MPKVKTKIGSVGRFKAKLEHLPDMVALLVAAGFDVDSKSLRRRCFAKGRITCVLRISGESQIIGLFSCATESGRWVMDHFVVHPEYQRQGIAKEIVGQLKRHLHTVQQSYLVALVPEDRLEAQVFLRDGARMKALKAVETPYGRSYLFFYRKPRK
jgi:ribosomal protein S18 acetylase RimI-like enzyme